MLIEISDSLSTGHEENASMQFVPEYTFLSRKCNWTCLQQNGLHSRFDQLMVLNTEIKISSRKRMIDDVKWKLVHEKISQKDYI